LFNSRGVTAIQILFLNKP